MNLYLRKLGALAPIFTFLTLFLFFSIITRTFLTWGNIVNILQQNSGLAIMAVGVTYVLLCAEIDLSIAAMATLSGVIAASVYVWLGKSYPGLPAVLQALVPLAFAICATAGLGTVNGLCTAWLGLPSFMVTLAMLLITKGLSIGITKGTPIFDIPPVVERLGTGALTLGPMKLPYIFLFAVLCLALGGFALRYTRFGRHVYMVGGNREAAELAGINAKAIVASCLAICGCTAGLSGLALIGRMGSAQAEGLDSMLINCISAVVLGGTSLFGGKGGIGNTVIGLLTLGVLHNGLNHVDVNIYMKEFISGVILLAALVLNVTMARMRRTE